MELNNTEDLKMELTN